MGQTTGFQEYAFSVWSGPASTSNGFYGSSTASAGGIEGWDRILALFLVPSTPFHPITRPERILGRSPLRRTFSFGVRVWEVDCLERTSPGPVVSVSSVFCLVRRVRVGPVGKLGRGVWVDVFGGPRGATKTLRW